MRERDNPDLRRLRVRIEDKGPIVALHWRGAPDEEAALARVKEVAGEAEAAGLATHWGRKVLELRPPVPFDKGLAVRDLVDRSTVRTALFGGDDATDLDAFDALDGARRRRRPRRRGAGGRPLRRGSGRRSSSAPTWSWTACQGFAAVLAALADP